MKKFLIVLLSLSMVLAFYGLVFAIGGQAPEPATGCELEDLTAFPWTSGPFLKGKYSVAFDKDPASDYLGWGGYQLHIEIYNDEKQTEMYSFPMPIAGYYAPNALCGTSAAYMKEFLAGVACKFKIGEDFGYKNVIDKKTKLPIGVYKPVLYDLTIDETFFCGDSYAGKPKEMISGTLTIRLVPYIYPNPPTP